jgi:hypothetical protein
MKKVAKHILMACLIMFFVLGFRFGAVCGMTSEDEDFLLLIPTIVGKTEQIVFTTEGSSFSPVLTVSGSPTILWTWADGTTSNSATPTKKYGSAGTRLNKLLVKPWSAVRRINIGYDGGDGGSYQIEPVPDQHVSAVRGLHHVAPHLVQWCSSYNQITSLDFSNFTSLDTIECFNSTSLRTVRLANTPKLRRVCFEDCNLESLDLSGSPSLEDLRGGGNDFPTIHFGGIGASLWHICVVDNPQLTNRTIFADMSSFPEIAELLIWNCNQTGTLRIPLTSPTRIVLIRADYNRYTSVDLSGALVNADEEAEVNLRENELTAIDITGCRQITRLYLENNRFDSSTLDAVLATLDALGRGEHNVAPGVLLQVDLRGNATPGKSGYAHAQSLAAKGWTVLTDGWALEP